MTRLITLLSLVVCLMVFYACSASKTARKEKINFQHAGKAYSPKDLDLSTILADFGEDFESKEAPYTFIDNSFDYNTLNKQTLEKYTSYINHFVYNEYGITFLVHIEDKILDNSQILKSSKPQLNNISNLREVRITSPDIKTNLKVKIGDSKEKVIKEYGTRTKPWGSLAYGNEDVEFIVDEGTGTVTEIILFSRKSKQ